MNLDLLTHIKHFGSAYNTEDSSLFFYALTKMKHYKTFVEFGTAFGCTAFAVASAMKENGDGKCITFDNGKQYYDSGIRRYPYYDSGIDYDNEQMSYSEFINSTVERLGIQNHFELSIKEIDFQSLSINKVDCVFSDFDRTVDVVEQLMSWALYSMNDYSSIFIDGLCNYDEGFYYTKLLVNMLNEKTIPISFMATEEQKKFVEDHHFSLTTIRKQDTHNIGQGGMCWIKIEPNNIRNLNVTPKL